MMRFVFNTLASLTYRLAPRFGMGPVIAVLAFQMRPLFSLELRENAIDILGNLRDERGRKHLLAAIADKNPAIRGSAVHAIRELEREDPATVQALMHALADPSPLVRTGAAKGLCFSLPMAIPSLMAALVDDHADVRRHAVVALETLDAKQAIDAIAGILCSDPDAEVRAEAASALAALDGERALAPLTAAFENGQSDTVRESVLMALGHSWNVQAIPLLCAALQDPEAEFRERAASALGSLMDRDKPACAAALGPLCAALRDDVVRVREEVADALGQLGDPRAGAFLVKALQDEEAAVREQVLKALARIDAAGNADHLLKGLEDTDIAVQRAAAEGLQAAGPHVLPAVLSHLKKPHPDEFVRAHLAEGLLRMGGADAIPHLIEVLGDESRWVLEAALKALTAQPDRRALPAVVPLLKNAEDFVRSEAALALAAIGDDAAIEPLGALLREEPEPSVRRRVAWALSFFTPAAALPLLTQALHDEDAHVQFTAVRALHETCEADTLQGIVDGLPRRLRQEVLECLDELACEGECDEESDEAGGEESEAPAKAPRSIRLGTVHYE